MHLLRGRLNRDCQGPQERRAIGSVAGVTPKLIPAAECSEDQWFWNSLDWPSHFLVLLGFRALFFEGFSEQAVGAVLGPWVNPAGGREGRLEQVRTCAKISRPTAEEKW
jgi:hypothetical protein